MGGLVGDRHRRFIVEAEQGRHRTGPDRYRLLHGKPAGAQQTRAVSNAEAAGRRQRGVFAKRVSGHEFGVPSDRETGLGLEYAQSGERDRHQRRLGVFGELQRLGRAVPDDRGQPFAKRRIDLVEHSPRRRKGLRQGLAHADDLGALPWKNECCRHWRSLISWGRKTLTRAGMSSQPRH